MTDVFISYSRRDATFVHELHEFLTSTGRDVWVDWEDIPPASEWERDIGESIDGAESFVFVVSAASLASQYCTIELEHAQKDGKRVVPIACEEVDPGTAPPALRELNWIWCRETDDRGEALAKLTRALDTDLEWARAHTRLLVRAVEWDERRDSSLLLRGRDLEDAARQLALNASNDPVPTELQQQYVLESRQATSRRQRITLGAVTLALAVSIGLGVLALLQRNEANDRARVAQSQALAAQAVAALASKPATALADGVRAVDTSPTSAAREALRRALLANPIEYVIPAGPSGPSGPSGSSGSISADPALAFSADGKLLLGLRPDGTLWLRRSATGRVDRSTRTPTPVAGAVLGPDRVLAMRRAAVLWSVFHRSTTRTWRAPAGRTVVGIGFSGPSALAAVSGGGGAAVVDLGAGRDVRLSGLRTAPGKAVFSGNGRRLVTLQPSAPGRVWDSHTGKQLMTLPEAPNAVVSADGRYVATTGYGEAKLWSVDTRSLVANLGTAVSVVFSPTGALAVAIGENGDAGVLRTRTGTTIATLPGYGTLHSGKGSFSSQFVPGAAFSTDERLLALADADGIVRVWELTSRKQVAAVRMGWVNTLAFSPRGDHLAGMTWDGDVVVARAPASIALRTGYEPSSCLDDFEPILDARGMRILAPARGGAAVWTVGGVPVQRLATPARPTPATSVGAAAFSGDGTVVAVAGNASGCARSRSQRLWTGVWRTGVRAPIRLLPATVSPLALDGRGSLLASNGRAWRTATGARVRALDGIVELGAGGEVALVARNGAIAIVRPGSGANPVELRYFGRFDRADVTAAFAPDTSRVVTRRQNQLRLWDTATGEPIARLGRPGEEIEGFGFGARGRLVLVRFDDRAATFAADDGAPVASAPGTFAAISPAGDVAATVLGDGSLRVVDLLTKGSADIQTDTGAPLVSATFGPDPTLLVAADENGDVHILRCAICGSESDVVARARQQLAVVSGFEPSRRRQAASGRR